MNAKNANNCSNTVFVDNILAVQLMLNEQPE